MFKVNATRMQGVINENETDVSESLRLLKSCPAVEKTVDGNFTFTFFRVYVAR